VTAYAWAITQRILKDESLGTWEERITAAAREGYALGYAAGGGK
jgi:hypothetical protein